MSFMLFSSFDEAWKGAEGPVGANWGIWRTNRMEKPAVAQVRAIPVAIALPSRAYRGNTQATVLRVDANGRVRAVAGVGFGAEAARMPAVWTAGR